MILLRGERVACEECIRGHRAADCCHIGKYLIEIKGRGRPGAKDPFLRYRIDPNPPVVKETMEEVENKNGRSKKGTMKRCLHLADEVPGSITKVDLSKSFKVLGPVTPEEIAEFGSTTTFKVNLNKRRSKNKRSKKSSPNRGVPIQKDTRVEDDYRRSSTESLQSNVTTTEMSRTSSIFSNTISPFALPSSEECLLQTPPFHFTDHDLESCGYVDDFRTLGQQYVPNETPELVNRLNYPTFDPMSLNFNFPVADDQMPNGLGTSSQQNPFINGGNLAFNFATSSDNQFTQYPVAVTNNPAIAMRPSNSNDENFAAPVSLASLPRVSSHTQRNRTAVFDSADSSSIITIKPEEQESFRTLFDQVVETYHTDENLSTSTAGEAPKVSNNESSWNLQQQQQQWSDDRTERPLCGSDCSGEGSDIPFGFVAR